MWQIVLDSDVIFHEESIHSPENPSKDFRKWRAATRRFQSMSRHQLQHTLHATLSSLPDKSSAQQCVAYVAAINGSNIAANARRVANARPAGKIWGHDDIGGMAEGRYNRIEEIYKRHPERAVRKLLLTAPSDGAGTETLIGIRLLLLRREPANILKTIKSDAEALALMRYALEREGSDVEKRTLQRFRNSSSYSLRRAVWLCLRSISDADNRRRQER